MHLELACSDSAVSRLCLGCYLLGRLPPGALSRLAGVFLFAVELMPVLSLGHQIHTGKKKRAERVFWATQ